MTAFVVCRPAVVDWSGGEVGDSTVSNLCSEWAVDAALEGLEVGLTSLPRTASPAVGWMDGCLCWSSRHSITRSQA
jgi:hypothetical protein